MPLYQRIEVAAAQADGKLSTDPVDRDLGWIFFQEFNQEWKDSAYNKGQN